MSKSRLCIADDHELFREGLASIFNKQPDLEVVGIARDGLEMFTMAHELKPDLILMDINMPIYNGLEATRRIKEDLPEITIIVLTILEEEDMLLEAIRSGADGYLLKNSSTQGFLRGIRGALAGEATFPRKLAARLIEEYANLANEPTQTHRPTEIPTLTFREVELLGLIATDQSNQEIAEALSISLYTVKSHIRSILKKLGVKNRWEAAAIAAELGIIRKNPKWTEPGLQD